MHGITPYSDLTGFAMCMNYIVGTGCFGLPFAFAEAGLAMNTCLLLGGGILAMISMNYTIEFLARAEAISSLRPGQAPNHRITFRRFDFLKVSGIFAGRTGTLLMQIPLFISALGTLWSFSSMFSSSTANVFTTYFLSKHCNVYRSDPTSQCVSTYLLFMGIFAAVVIFLVLMDMSEQATVQKYLTLYRVLALGAMFVTLVVKVNEDGLPAMEHRARLIGAWNLGEFAKGFGPCMLAINCHYNIPNVIQPLRSKANVRVVPQLALGVAIVLYLFLGILGALAFDNISPMVSLNWASYTACGGGWDLCIDDAAAPYYAGARRIYAHTIRLFIVLFPVFNIISTYPMICLTLGDNITLAVPDSVKRRISHTTVTGIARICCVLPPIALAAVFKKLDVIFSIAGIFGFTLQLTMPCYLNLLTIDYCEETYGKGSSVTPFSLGFLSWRCVVQALFLLSFVMVGIAFVNVLPHIV
eukprot:jgi/Bigna1/56269/estExt_Genewise1Plus.C_900038